MTIAGFFLSGTTEDGTPHYQLIFDTRVRIAAPFKSKEALERAQLEVVVQVRMLIVQASRLFWPSAGKTPALRIIREWATTQLEKYRLDHLLHFGSVPFEEVRRGGEPPDFVVQQVQNDWRIDCAAFAIQGRRQAEALFYPLVQRLTERGNSAWTNLADCDVSISFPSPSLLPPAKNDTSLDAEIDAALASIVVDHERLAQFATKVAAEGFPSQWPNEIELPILQHEHFRLVAHSVPGWQPRDQLAARLGFHLNLQYPVTLHEMSSEVNRMVLQHDNSTTQQLLLSVGGPGLDGYRYTAENMLGEMLRNLPIQQVEARHLERVTAHVWESGDLIDIPVVRPT